VRLEEDFRSWAFSLLSWQFALYSNYGFND
jgi:hypothetical protein